MASEGLGTVFETPMTYVKGRSRSTFESHHQTGNGKRVAIPFTSSPVTSTQIARWTLGESDSMNMTDICDTFKKTLRIGAGADAVPDDITLKRAEMDTAVQQLNLVASAIFPDNIGDVVGDMIVLNNPTTNALGTALALLEPVDITPAGISSVLSLHSHRMLQKKTLLATLKAQTQELKLERKTISNTVMDIRSEIEETKNKIKQYEEEMQAADSRELKMLSEAYEAEIEAETEQFHRLETIVSNCSKEKIEAAMQQVQALNKKAESLANELEYSKTLPANLREIRALVEARKRHLQEVIYKVEDLMEFGYKS